jgi:O-antigen/teichoic acid export membrane protein
MSFTPASDDPPILAGKTPDPSMPPLGASPPDRATRDRSLVHGVAWNGMVKLVVQGAAWASTLVVARLLSPDDYGVMGLATLFLGLIELVTEFGIGIAVATRKDLTESQTKELNSVAAMMGVAGALAICLIAPLAGKFFHDPRLPAVLMALSLTFLLGSLRSVPWGLLQRDLRFKRLAVYDGLQALALAALSVVLALLGFRYWTLVIASIASALITALIAILRHPVAFRWPRVRALKSLLSFSGNIVGQRAAWYGYSNSDFFIAGKMLGSSALGNYSLAWNLSHVTDKVTALVLQITPPVLAKVQDDRAEMRRYVIRITEAMSLTVMPLMIGLALVANDFVPLVLGAKWREMIFPLQVLSAYATVNVVLPLFGQVLNVTGHEAFGMRHNILQFVVMPTMFVLGAYLGGVNGIAIAWVVGHPLLGLRLARYTLRTIDLPLTEYFKAALSPSLVACVTMSLAVIATHLAWPHAAPSVARLTLEIFVGAVVYLATLMVFFSQRLVGIRDFARQMFPNRRIGPVDA